MGGQAVVGKKLTDDFTTSGTDFTSFSAGADTVRILYTSKDYPLSCSIDYVNHCYLFPGYEFVSRCTNQGTRGTRCRAWTWKAADLR